MLDPQELNGPIPGQSLTSEPKGSAWERPPEMSDPGDAARWHIGRLREAEAMEATLDVLELGVDVVTLTKGILRGAVAEGVHSVDISMVIAPLIHESIRGVAEAAQIDFNEGLAKDDDRSDIDYRINERKARVELDRMAAELPEVAEEMPMEEMPMEDAPMEEPRAGLMVPKGGLT